MQIHGAPGNVTQLSATNRIQIAFLRIYFAAGVNIGDIIRHNPLERGHIGMLQRRGASLFAS